VLGVGRRVAQSSTIGIYLLAPTWSPIHADSAATPGELVIDHREIAQKAVDGAKLDMGSDGRVGDAGCFRACPWGRAYGVIVPPESPLHVCSGITCASGWHALNWREPGPGRAVCLNSFFSILNVPAYMQLGSTEAVKAAVRAGWEFLLVLGLRVSGRSAWPYLWHPLAGEGIKQGLMLAGGKNGWSRTCPIFAQPIC